MKIMVIETDVEFARKSVIPKLSEWFANFKSKYQIDDDLSFELMEGTVDYSDNGKNYLFYNEHLLTALKDEYDKNQNIGVIMRTVISEQGFKNCYKQCYPQDDLAKQVTNAYINFIPIFYIAGNCTFSTGCVRRFGMDLSQQFLPKTCFSDNYTGLLNERIEKMFLYFITGDENKLDDFGSLPSAPTKKKGIK